MNISLNKIKISNCRTFHQIENDDGGLKALYSKRFLEVEKFHSVTSSTKALAPVIDGNVAYHIDLNGSPSYKDRFDKTFGFYGNKAAVMLNGEFFHINIDGIRLYRQSYDWVGNFQEDLCVVKKDSHFFHINHFGERLYDEEYDYVGDFKDDIAVIYKNDLATHIDKKGNFIHGKFYKKLGIFHKNYANAEDDKGWFHINRDGTESYKDRYKMVEPFYNGLAFVETFEGKSCQINNSGDIVHEIHKPDQTSHMHKISSKFVGFWYVYLSNAASRLGLLHLLPGSLNKISQSLEIPKKNLLRFLRALWEIDLVYYHQDHDIWELSNDGQFLVNNPFLLSGAKMWARVVREDNWLKIEDMLKKENILSFPTFKESESESNEQIEYYKVLIGYSKFDFKAFQDNVKIDKNTKVVLFGVHSLALIQTLMNQYYCQVHYFNEPKLPAMLLDDYKIDIVNSRKSLQNSDYDLLIFSRFFQQYDDKIVQQHIDYITSTNVNRFLIIETLFDTNNSLCGCVDINLMVESSGKLRSIDEWENFINSTKLFKLDQIIPLTGYLSVLDIKRI